MINRELSLEVAGNCCRYYAYELYSLCHETGTRTGYTLAVTIFVTTMNVQRECETTENRTKRFLKRVKPNSQRFKHREHC